MIYLRTYKPEDYPKIVSWYEGHDRSPVQEDMLSSFGFITHDGEIDLAAGWAYFTNSKIAIMEFLITNPKAPIGKRAVAVKNLIRAVIKEIDSYGARYIFTPVENESLLNWYRRLGFTPYRNITLMGTKLWELKPH